MKFAQNPRQQVSERGLLLKGLLKPLPKKGEVPDCLLVEPFTEEVVPANAAAVLAHLPSAGPDAAYCYAKPPGDAESDRDRPEDPAAAIIGAIPVPSKNSRNPPGNSRNPPGTP